MPSVTSADSKTVHDGHEFSCVSLYLEDFEGEIYQSVQKKHKECDSIGITFEGIIHTIIYVHIAADEPIACTRKIEHGK